MIVVVESDAPESTAVEPTHAPDRVDRIVERLISEYGELVGEGVVLEQVSDAVGAMAEARLQHFVPIFVERDARRCIRAYIANGGGTS